MSVEYVVVDEPSKLSNESAPDDIYAFRYHNREVAICNVHDESAFEWTAELLLTAAFCMISMRCEEVIFSVMPIPEYHNEYR